METAFQTVKDTDRIWVYQADRILSDEEAMSIKESGKAFVSTWAAHGQALRADVLVLYNHFVIVTVDEKQAKASGCSIDKSVSWIMEMGEKYGIDFLNRQHVAWMDESDSLQTASLSEFETLASNGQIDEDVLVFNNLIFSGKELKNSWLVPARESWHARYFNVAALN